MVSPFKERVRTKEDFTVVVRNVLGLGPLSPKVRTADELLDVVKFDPGNPNNILPDRFKPGYKPKPKIPTKHETNEKYQKISKMNPSQNEVNARKSLGKSAQNSHEVISSLIVPSPFRSKIDNTDSAQNSREATDVNNSSLSVPSPFRINTDKDWHPTNLRPNTSSSSIYSQDPPADSPNYYTQKPLPNLPSPARNTARRAPPINMSSQLVDSNQSPRHGRSSSRNTSPTKPLSDLKENEVVLFPHNPVRTPPPFKHLNMSDSARDSEHLNLKSVRFDRFPPASPTKRSRSPIKDLFGPKGILGRSTSMKELPSDVNRKFGFKALGDKFKQRAGIKDDDAAKQPADLLTSSGSSKKAAKSPATFPVSLDPRHQAFLLAEVELMICVTANKFLKNELKAGRVSLEATVKLTNGWKARNRAQVVEFQFDQLTQCEFISWHMDEFRFYGPCAEDPIALQAMFKAWKTLAKEMSVRTHCNPDSMLKKQMTDIYKILELLGAATVTFLAFQELHVTALKTMEDKEKKRAEKEKIQFGIPKNWEPPAGSSSRVVFEGREIPNPFDDGKDEDED